MRLEYYPAEQLKKEILSIVGKSLDLGAYRVFFFGSRVTGKGSDRSDIDVGIEGPKAIPWGIKSEIEEEVEKIPTLYKIDVVDFRTVSSQFREVAMDCVEYLND